MRMTQYTTKSHGTVVINENKKKITVWLDPEEVMEGCALDVNDELFKDYAKDWFEGIDFSDLPKNGEFKSVKDAKKYLESKFGKLMEPEQ